MCMSVCVCVCACDQVELRVWIPPWLDQKKGWKRLQNIYQEKKWKFSLENTSQEQKKTARRCEASFNREIL